MIDPVLANRWSYWLLFVLVSVAVIFVQLLPFQIGFAGLPGPDVIVLMTFVWLLRRPDYVPAPLIALVLLATDILFMRPMGLWAGIVVVGAEFLRSRTHYSRDLPFLVEWILVAAVLLIMTLANGAVLAILMVDQPAIGLTLLQLSISVFCYPLVVAFSGLAVGVRKMAPGEADAIGQRL